MLARTALATALVLWGSGTFAAPPREDINTRVTRLEQVVSSQTLVDMLTRLESLQQEVQQLRGIVEEQRHALDSLQRRQRELYLDTDRRLSRLEQATGGAAGSAAGPVPADATPGEAGAAEQVEAAMVSAASAEEQNAYRQALDLLQELHYEEATKAFRGLLQSYPQGRYAHVAQYWIGEASYAQRDFKNAVVEYRRLVEAYPQSPKVPEALLKIGTSQQELGERDEAIKVLTTLVQEHPDTTEAGQARVLLQQIKSAQ